MFRLARTRIVTTTPSSTIAGQRGIYVENNCSGVRIRNTIIALSGEEPHRLYETRVDPRLSSNRAFTNLVWDTSGPRTGQHLRASMLDLSDGSRAWSGLGSNMSSDARFVCRANRDYPWASAASPPGSPTRTTSICSTLREGREP